MELKNSETLGMVLADYGTRQDLMNRVSRLLIELGLIIDLPIRKP